MKKIFITTESDLRDFAFDFVKTLRGGEIIGLVGDLGAGKTTFVKYLAEALGIAKPVRSPTFIIMQIFDVPKQSSQLNISTLQNPHNPITSLVHIDAYRMKDYPEFMATGFLDYIGAPGTVIFIEWPDRVSEVRDLPGYRELRFTFQGQGREVDIV